MINISKIFFRSFIPVLTIVVIGGTTAMAGVKTAVATGNWGTAATWSPASLPSASDSIVIPNGITVTLNVNGTCGALNIQAGGSLNYSGNNRTLTVSSGSGHFGGVTIAGSLNFGSNNGQTLTFAGNFSCTGTYNSGTGNNAGIIYQGARTSTISSTANLKSITVNNANGVLKATSLLTLTGNLTVTAGTFNPNGFLITGSGTNTLSVTGTLIVDAATFTGNYSGWETRTLNAASTVNYSGIDQTIDNTLTYSSLTISGSGTKTLGGNLPALNSSSSTSGNIRVLSGTLGLSSFTANRGTTRVGGTFSIANVDTLKIGGTNTFPANYATHTLGVTSTVEYSGTNQSVSLESYGNLKLSSSSGAATKTMPASAMTIAGNLESTLGAGTSVSFTAGNNLTVSGSVSIGTSTTFNGGSFSHVVAGNWTNNGTFSGGTSTVTMSGVGAIISGTGNNNFNNLTITGPGITVSSNTDLAVAGNLSTSGAGTFTHTSGGTGTITMTGASKSIGGTGIALNNLTISGTITTTTSLTIAGNLLVSNSFSATAGIITMSGTSKTVSGAGTITLNALNVSGSVSASSSFSLTSDLSVAGSLTATAGTASFTGTSTLSGTANLNNVTLNGTILQLGSNSVLGIAGILTLTAGTFDVTTTTPNTVNFNGSGTQTINAIMYHHLSVSTGGTKTAGGAITLNGGLTINPGATIDAGSFTHTLYGNWTNSGSFTAGSSTIRFLGPLDASITGTTTYNTLTINKGASTNIITLNNDVNVSSLNMTTGQMRTESNTLTITSTRTGSGIILGTITRTHTFAPLTAYAFEGPNQTITFSTVGSVNSVTVTTTLGLVSDFPFGASVNRQYNISVTGSGYGATLRLHYEDTELNGNVESTMNLWHYNGTNWVTSGKTANDTVNNWVEQNLLSDITNRWTFSDNQNVVRWNGSTSSAWETATNWTVVQGSASTPPSSTDIVQLGTAAFTNQPTISSTATVKIVSFGSTQAAVLTLGSGGSLMTNGNISGTWNADATHALSISSQTLTVGGDLILSDGVSGHAINLSIGAGTVTITGDITESGGANITFTGSGTLNIGGNFNYISGVFSASTGTVTYNGTASQSIAGNITYNHLIIDKPSGTATLSASATVSGDLTTSTSAVVDINASLIVAGNITINPGTTLNGNGSTILAGGNWIRSGTFTPGTGSVRFNGTSSQAIGATTFNNLVIDKPSGTATLAGSLLLNGDLTVSSGTLDLTTFTANRSALGGTFALSSNSILKIGTGSSFPLNYATTMLDSASTVEYNGTDTQTVVPMTYGNLVLTNGSTTTKNLSGPTTVANDLLINNGATLSASSFSLTLRGNWTNNGTFDYGSSTVTLNGMNPQTMSGSAFYNLIIANSVGVTILTNETVEGTLTLQNGNITTGSNTLVIGTNGSVSRISGHIIGNLGKVFLTGVQLFTFDIGDTLNYTPIALSFANVTSGGNVTAKTTASEHPNISTSGINSTKSVNRYWTLTGGGGIAFSTYDATFNFVASDVDTGANPDLFVVQRFSGIGWDTTTIGTHTSTSTQATGITTFGDFAIGEQGGRAVAITLTSGDNQTGVVGTALANPFVVTVTDTFGNPVQGISVTFAIASFPPGAAGQSLSVTNTTTDVLGQASTVLTLGDSVGTYTVTATSMGLAGSPITFTATATPPTGLHQLPVLPTEFELSQNYPNPFNPETIIKYQLPKDAYVTMRLYDLLGREVRTLVDEFKQAGYYQITLNASQLASGMYIYRMVAGSYVAARKLVVVK